MSSLKASANSPRMSSALTRTLYATGFSLAATALSTTAFAGCQYVVDNQWNNGFTAKIRITNDGTTPINGWDVKWSYAGDNRITSSYNATFGGTNPYTASNLSWNGTIQPNQSVEFGFQGTKGNTTAEVPVVTGAACGTATAPSSAPVASAPASSRPVASSSSAPSGVAQNVSPLSVQGNKVVANGQPANLAGMSLFWSNTGWGGEKYYTAGTVSWLKNDWKANLVRVAMGVEDEGGYLEDSSNKTRSMEVIDAAIANGMYVIIDWHTHRAELNKPAAIAFFKEMATKYGQYNNVIYEVYNEPLAVSWSSVIKPYATDVIREIRAIDPDNLIIVGTPNWSQDVDAAANDPITSYNNIAYTLHFYAGTHKQWLRDKAQSALNRGIALFATEWGTVNADGDGGVDVAETNTWLNFLKTNGISHANWALNDKIEGASALVAGASANGGWTSAQLTESGAFVRNAILTQNQNGNSSTAPTLPSSVASSSVRSSSVAPVVPSSSSVASVPANPGTGAGVLFSETFENGAVNTQPAGWQNFIGWVPNNSNSPTGTEFALIDSTKAYSGTKSIRFKAGAAPAQIVRELPAGTQRLYTRAYVNMSVAMGNVPGDNHEHIFGIKKTFDANDEIRVGQIKGVLGTNHIPSDNIAPKMDKWGSGPQMKANTWYCVETAYLADQAYDSLYMWVDGQLVHSITSANDWNNGALPADWMSDKFKYVMFGFHSFSGRSANVWMDDLVVSTQPIGCGSTPAPAPTSSSAPSSSSAAPVVPSSSSVAPVVPSSSSVASSSVAAVSSVASSSVASVPSAAQWSLNAEESFLNFVTTKNTHNVEVMVFKTLSGDITNNVASLVIDLNSVDSGVGTRDGRMRDLLFKTTDNPTANVSVELSSTLISSIAVGQTKTQSVLASVTINGKTNTVSANVAVQKLTGNKVLVQTLLPVLIKADDFNLVDGIEALRNAASLNSISVAVPVDFALVFDAR